MQPNPDRFMFRYGGLPFLDRLPTPSKIADRQHSGDELTSDRRIWSVVLVCILGRRFHAVNGTEVARQSSP